MLIEGQAIFDIHAIRHASGPTAQANVVLFDTLDSLAGLVFLGVPHLGSRIEEKKRVQIINGLATIWYSNPKALLAALGAESQHLSMLCTNFERTTLFNEGKVQVYSYYETVNEKKVAALVRIIHDYFCVIVH